MDSVLNISDATKKNWERLKVTKDEMASKLSKRANKLLSNKHIIPNEYFSNKKNLKVVKNILEIILKLNLSIEEIIYNLGINYLKMNNLIEINGDKVISKNQNIEKILSEIEQNFLIEELLKIKLPDDEIDILGIIYQSLMSEGNKNKKGSYYTPSKIIERVFSLVNSETILLDPCCGTGSFLLNLADKIENPLNIYGVESDKISSFISKINLIVKYKEIDFYPNIYNLDFLEDEIIEKLNGKNINLVATNPPWGTKYGKDYSKSFPQILSKEIYSYFIVQSEKLLSKNGICCFVLPESILNVDVHKDIRKFILDNYSIEEIKHWGKAFKGVLSDVISIKLSKNNVNKVRIFYKNSSNIIDKSVFVKNRNYFFNLTDTKNIEVLNYIYAQPYETLKDSKWGLGIVTGNNDKHIKKQIKDGEKIFSGKNLDQYFITDSDRYILYKRENFQQAASDEIYRANEKLVYKFVSKKLVFAYDNEKRLFINSANILIPIMQTHSIKTVMAFLNSKVFAYIYKNKFNALKILKGNLVQLPFPKLTVQIHEEIEKLVDNYLENKDNKTLENIDNIVFETFNLPKNYINIINE